MLTPITYAERLRFIGAALDAREVRELLIIEHDDRLSVLWQTRHGRFGKQSYREEDLAARIAEVQRRRGRSATGRETLAELLRTLGQELDQEGPQNVQVATRGGAYEANWVAGQEYVRRHYVVAKLLELSQARQALRSPQADVSEIIAAVSDLVAGAPGEELLARPPARQRLWARPLQYLRPKS